MSLFTSFHTDRKKGRSIGKLIEKTDDNVEKL